MVGEFTEGGGGDEFGEGEGHDEFREGGGGDEFVEGEGHGGGVFGDKMSSDSLRHELDSGKVYSELSVTW